MLINYRYVTDGVASPEAGKVPHVARLDSKQLELSVHPEPVEGLEEKELFDMLGCRLSNHNKFSKDQA